MTNPYRVSPLRLVAALTASLVLGSAPAIFTGEWHRALVGVAVVAAAIAAAWIGYRTGHAAARAERAYQVELARGSDPDPFNGQLRIEHRDEPTYDLTHGAYNPEARTDRDGHAFYSGLDTFELTARLHDLGVPPHIAAAEAGEYVDSDSKQITWHPTITDTTGETR